MLEAKWCQYASLTGRDEYDAFTIAASWACKSSPGSAGKLALAPRLAASNRLMSDWYKVQ
ncbi:MAG: hypothetical protein ACK5YR_11575 [Pirellula sp.]